MAGASGSKYEGWHEEKMREEYRRGFRDGIREALGLMSVQSSLTGAYNAALAGALRRLLPESER